MRFIQRLLCTVALLGFAAAACAAAPAPKNGVEYLTLPTAQNTDAGKKVEVIEFFAYYCPHCHAFDPLLAAWVKKQGDNIAFKRVHISMGPHVLAQQTLFYTLDAMGLAEQYHGKVFAAIHNERKRLDTDAAVFAWARENGINMARFMDTYRSFGLSARLRRADSMMEAYHVDSWPMVAIDGRFTTSPSQAGTGMAESKSEAGEQQAALQVMDYLVAKAKAEKK